MADAVLLENGGLLMFISALGESVFISRFQLMKIALAAASPDVLNVDLSKVFDDTTDGFNQARREADRFVTYHLERIGEELSQTIKKLSAGFYTQEEKLRRMREGWRPYRLPVSSLILNLRRRLQLRMSSENIGCLNFKRKN